MPVKTKHMPSVEGWKAAQAGEASCSCPYEEGTEDASRWRHGHSESIRIATPTWSDAFTREVNNALTGNLDPDLPF